MKSLSKEKSVHVLRQQSTASRRGAPSTEASPFTNTVDGSLTWASSSARSGRHLVPVGLREDDQCIEDAFTTYGRGGIIVSPHSPLFSAAAAPTSIPYKIKDFQFKMEMESLQPSLTFINTRSMVGIWYQEMPFSAAFSCISVLQFNGCGIKRQGCLLRVAASEKQFGSHPKNDKACLVTPCSPEVLV